MNRQRRRLAAILFADVVGSSRLIGRDESGTVARLLEHLTRRLAPIVRRHDGRTVRLTGDGGLVEFASAVDALAAAIDFQQAMAAANRDVAADDAIAFRIGLHIGDVIVEHDDLYGDDVNVAARLQEQAAPGGIVVSRNVWEAVAGRHKARFEQLGDLELKNIDRPISAFVVHWDAADWPAVPEISPAAHVWPSMAPSPHAARRVRLALWSAAVVGCVALAGIAYVAFAPRPPPTLAELQALKAEDLERLLIERRAADAAAAEKKRLEEEAQRKAEADAEALRQAVADLEKARLDRQKAEADLAELRLKIEGIRREAATASQQQLADTAAWRAAEDEAHRRAEVEMASLRQAEQDALQKAALEAENKRLADVALVQAQAARQKADEEAASRRRAEEKLEATTRQKADAEAAIVATHRAKVEAEVAESALHLAVADRQHLQVALTALGFDTRGTDGMFGPRTRDMIAGWQKKMGVPATGFLNAGQRAQLLAGAAAAIARWDDEHRRLEEAPNVVPAPPPAPPAPTNVFDGAYVGARRAPQQMVTARIRISGGSGAGTIDVPGCSASAFSMTVSLTGDVRGSGDLNCPVPIRGTGNVVGPFVISGHAVGRTLQFSVSTSRGEFDVLMDRSTSTANAP
ncbi:adenylate/guanylate cyclase domain-containing protein [Reyranella sp.]|uniref:adenylate/guanylate cyclase domain-containing protein n=1 Tax=Reyranella sp. TaxID=1929291 RepID=UPI003D12D3EE